MRAVDVYTGVGGFFFFQAEDGIRDSSVTGVQTCALPISAHQEEVEALKVALTPGTWANATFSASTSSWCAVSLRYTDARPAWAQRCSAARRFVTTSTEAPRHTNATARENTLKACRRHSRIIPLLALRVVLKDNILPRQPWLTRSRRLKAAGDCRTRRPQCPGGRQSLFLRPK